MASAAVTDVESSEAVQKAPRRRKCKNHLVQLAEMFPDVVYNVAAAYGSSEDQIYVMEVTVDEQVFQGIGPSKIKAKIMAAELALINYGALSEMTVSPTDVTDVFSADDFSADCVQSALFYDFSKKYSEIDESVPWDTGHLAESANKSSFIASASDDGANEGDVLAAVEDDDIWSRFVGKTPLTIIVELQLDARYALLAETGDQLHPLFAMSVTIDGKTFRAAGNSKKIAKARAARNALCKIYNLEFGTSENGMPIYEGSEDIWESYKEKLEKDAELLVQPGRNPVLVMADFFPEAVYELDATANTSHFYTAKVTVLDKSYSGLGTTKTDAKTNAAANALEELRANGAYAVRQRKLNSQRRGLLDWQMMASQLSDSKFHGTNKNAVAKLNLLFRDKVRFCDLSETPVRDTSFTAFTVAVSVDGQHYIGVGKTKKAARSAAAERALISMHLWTDEDESVKLAPMMEVDEDPVTAVYRMQDEIAQEREMHSLEQSSWNKSQRPQSQWNPDFRRGNVRGRGGWNMPSPGRDPDMWSGPFQHDPGEWTSRGPGSRGRSQPVRGMFDNHRGRPDIVRGRDSFRGGNVSQTFNWNPRPSNTNSRGSLEWNKAGQASGGRGGSGNTWGGKSSFPPRPTPKLLPSSSSFHSTVTSAASTAPLSQFPSNSSLTPASISAASQWSFVADPTKQHQAPASYQPTSVDLYMSGVSYQNMSPGMTFAGNSASSFIQQSATHTNTMPSYGAYSGTGYESMYGQSNYGYY